MKDRKRAQGDIGILKKNVYRSYNTLHHSNAMEL
jgi:hypothetical protein